MFDLYAILNKNCCINDNNLIAELKQIINDAAINLFCEKIQNKRLELYQDMIEDAKHSSNESLTIQMAISFKIEAEKQSYKFYIPYVKAVRNQKYLESLRNILNLLHGQNDPRSKEIKEQCRQEINQIVG